MKCIKSIKRDKEMYKAQKYIAKNLRLLRLLQGVSQEKIANMLHMSRSSYSCLENGTKIPDFMTIFKLSEFYDIGLDYLLSFDISEQILSLLRSKDSNIEDLNFMERYLSLSHGAKFQAEIRLQTLLEKERAFTAPL